MFSREIELKVAQRHSGSVDCLIAKTLAKVTGLILGGNFRLSFLHLKNLLEIYFYIYCC